MKKQSEKISLKNLDDSLGNGPDWFWQWVEWNQEDENLLPAWFRQASTDQLKSFWRTYFDEVLGALIPEYEGFLIEEEGGFHLSEDDMADFNNWVIVQGKSIWEKMAQEAKIREESSGKYDDLRLKGIFEIYHFTRTDGEDVKEMEWMGVKWLPRDGYFPGDMADFIYEERFGLTLWEQMD